MDTIRIGGYLRELRKEKELTQEQLAERFNVSRRTVSRWETGSNMPDLDLVMELADFYEVDLREILDGERKSEKMNKELEATVKKVAEYSGAEKEKSARVVRVYFILGILALIINIALDFLELEGTFWTGFLKGSTMGMALGAMILGLLFITGRLTKIREFKLRVLGNRE